MQTVKSFSELRKAWINLKKEQTKAKQVDTCYRQVTKPVDMKDFEALMLNSQKKGN